MQDSLMTQVYTDVISNYCTGQLKKMITVETKLSPMKKENTYTPGLKEDSLEDLYFETGVLAGAATSLLTMFYFWISTGCLAATFGLAIAGIILNDKALKTTFLTACAATVLMLLAGTLLMNLTELAADLILIL